jgi:hypothetical protein
VPSITHASVEVIFVDYCIESAGLDRLPIGQMADGVDLDPG